MNPLYSKAFDLLHHAERIFLTSHVNPDGDAVGSLLALGWALKDRGKDVTMALQDAVPVSCRFLPGSEEIKSPPIEGKFDLCILLDAENPSRAGTLGALFCDAPQVLVIDHHPSDKTFATVEIRETHAAATGEILTGFLDAGEFPITPDIAECLMAAIMLDTGGFRHSSASPQTFRAAAELLEKGAHPPIIYRELFENRTLASAKLMGAALTHLQTAANGQIVYTAVTCDDFKKSGADENDTDGINVQITGVQGAEATAFFRESATGGVRVSLRSRNYLDCNTVARAFGGGGHVRASGCTVHEPLETAIRLILAEMEKQLLPQP